MRSSDGRRLAVAVVAGAVLSTGITVGPAPYASADELADAQRRANQAAHELSQAETALAKAGDAMDRVRARADLLGRQVDDLRTQLGQLAIRRYVEGTKPLSRLFGLEDANQAVRAQQYATVAAGTANDTVRRFRAQREDLQAQLGDLRREEERQQSALGALQRRRSAAVAELTRLTELDRQRREQAARAAQRRPSQAAGTPVKAQLAGPIASGDWICPVAGPHSFSNDYGAPRGGGRSHQGNDILAPRGTPVVANVSGDVSPNHSSLGGNSYFLHGSDGNTYFGAHLDSYGASGSVSAGTVIGYVGDTGDAQGGPTHLHFEIHPGGGGPVNPYSTLTRYC